MDIKNFLDGVCKEIKYESVRKPISEELESHIQEIKEDYIKLEGLEENVAEEKAIKQMGEPNEIGKKLNKIHRPKFDWKLMILVGVLMGFGIFISAIKQSELSNSYIGNTIIYMIVGLIIGIAIYFFDYRKLKKYSNVIYVLASIILLLPLIRIRVFY